MSTVKEITSPEEFKSHTGALSPKDLLVLYFHAPWAAPCAQMSAVLEALASTYPTTAPLSFVSVNAEELPDISEEHDVTAVPFIVLERGDKTLETISGTDAAKVRSAVEKHAGTENGARGAQLPPAQQVTRPKEQPAPKDPNTVTASNGVPITSTTNGDAPPVKNLSAYAPGASDPSTAPQYSSGTAPGLSTKTENDPSSEEDLNTRLSQLVKAAPCMLFMKGTPSAPQCGFSRQLVSILRENGVRYGFFNILADDEVRQGLKTFADWPTFPQLWLGGELVGGLDIVKEELENDPSFFDEYSVDTSKRNAGGPAAPAAQAQPQAA